MKPDWTRTEVEALVADYFAMLDAELRGKEYNKTAHRQALALLLEGRSHGSIERKHQNVSAVLIELGFPYIDGYKPLFNFQGLLFEVVEDQLLADIALQATAGTAVEAPAIIPDVDDILNRWEDPPERARHGTLGGVRERFSGLPHTMSFLERESRNVSLGRAGVQFALQFERARLIHAGRHALADRVEHVVETVGSGPGFDVQSFELNGDDRLITVKTTAYGKHTPFLLYRNEIRSSRERARSCHLYRVFRFREDPRVFGLRGALDETCELDPVKYLARAGRISSSHAR